MRSTPFLLLVLLAIVGLGLGLKVMLRQQAAVPADTAVLAASGQRGGAPSATGAEATESGAVPQGHVYTGVADEPGDVNPYTSDSNVARRLVLAFTHESLLDTDPRTGQLRPALASAYELSPDGTSCTFTLRDGVRFADGAPLTMADVTFGWELAKAGHLPLGFVGESFRRVEDVEVLDEHRLRVHFRGVFYAATQAVGEAWLVGQRQFFVDRTAEQAKLAGEPVPEVGSAAFARLLGQVDEECGPGTGPYQLQNRPGGERTWRRRQDLLLTRNAHCWRRQAQPGCWNFDGVRILFRDPTGAVQALLAGEIDWYIGPAIDALMASRPELAKAYRRLEYDYDTLGVYLVYWNCRRPPFDDARVRRALAHLFDHDALHSVFGRGARTAFAFCKPNAAEYPKVPLLAFDPGQTRRELREVGFDPDQGKPLHLDLLAVQGTEPLRRTVEFLVDAARTAGIDLQVRSRDFPQFLTELAADDWDGAFVMQSFRPWGDPYEFVHSQGLLNRAHWQNAEADRLAAEARTTLDVAARTELLRELHTLVYEQQPVTFLMHPTVVMLLNTHLENAVPGPGGLAIDRAFVARPFQRE